MSLDKENKYKEMGLHGILCMVNYTVYYEEIIPF